MVHIPSVESYRMIHPRPRDRLIRRLYPKADAIIAVSQGVTDNLVQIVDLSPEVIHTIHNYNVAKEIETKARRPVDHPWFAPGGPLVILAVGRMVPKKDYLTLIRAFNSPIGQQSSYCKARRTIYD